MTDVLMAISVALLGATVILQVALIDRQRACIIAQRRTLDKQSAVLKRQGAVINGLEEWRKTTCRMLPRVHPGVAGRIVLTSSAGEVRELIVVPRSDFERLCAGTELIPLTNLDVAIADIVNEQRSGGA